MSKKEAEKALAKLIDKVENGGFKNADQVIDFVRSMKVKKPDDLPESTTDKDS